VNSGLPLTGEIFPAPTLPDLENKDIHKVDSLVAVYFLAFIQKVRGCPCCFAQLPAVFETFAEISVLAAQKGSPDTT